MPGLSDAFKLAEQAVRELRVIANAVDRLAIYKIWPTATPSDKLMIRTPDSGTFTPFLCNSRGCFSLVQRHEVDMNDPRCARCRKLGKTELRPIP